MDRKQRNLRHEQNKAFYRAMAMPTVGPNSYSGLFEEAQIVCLLKLPNAESIIYNGAEQIRSAFINAAKDVYFKGSKDRSVSFAFFDSLSTEPAVSPLSADGNKISFYKARLRIRGKKREISTSYRDAFGAGATRVGSVDVINIRGLRTQIEIPDLTEIVSARSGIVIPENVSYLGQITKKDVINLIGDMGITLHSREEAVRRVVLDRYGSAPTRFI